MDVHGFRVIIDYCHNVDGMRRLTEFVDLTMAGDGARRGGTAARAAATNGKSGARSGRAIGVIGIPGDRRNEDQRQYGYLAARSFDEILVREDKNLRGRKPGETAQNVLEGIRRAQTDGKARATQAEPVLEELAAAKEGMRRARAGDLVVICADDSTAVFREAMALDRGKAGRAIGDPGEFSVPEG